MTILLVLTRLRIKFSKKKHPSESESKSRFTAVFQGSSCHAVTNKHALPDIHSLGPVGSEEEWHGEQQITVGVYGDTSWVS